MSWFIKYQWKTHLHAALTCITQRDISRSSFYFRSPLIILLITYNYLYWSWLHCRLDFVNYKISVNRETKTDYTGYKAFYLVSISVCVYQLIFVYVCVYTNMDMHPECVFACVQTWAYACIWLSECACVRACAYECTCMSECKCIWMCTCVCAWIYVHKCVNVCACTKLFNRF